MSNSYAQFIFGITYKMYLIRKPKRLTKRDEHKQFKTKKVKEGKTPTHGRILSMIVNYAVQFEK